MDRRRFLPTYHYEDNTGGLLKDSAGKPLRDYKIYGNSFQDGVPSPEAPVEIQSVGDKSINLFDEVSFINMLIEAETAGSRKPIYETIDGKEYFRLYGTNCSYKDANGELLTNLRYSFKENTQYTVSFDYVDVKVTGTDGIIRVGVLVYVYYTDGSNSVVLVNNNNRHDKAHVSFTTLTDKTVDCVRFSYGTGMAYTYFANFQIAEGSVEKEYEAYGQYKVPIKVIGKNLYDAETHFNNAYESETLNNYKPTKGVVDGVECYEYWARNFSNDTPENVRYLRYGFKENTQYTLSLDRYDIYYNNISGINLQVHYTDGTHKHASVVTFGVDADRTWKHHTYTSLANKTIKYIMFSFATGAAQTYFANMQIEEGTVETSYEPYKDLGTTNIYLTEPLRKVDEYADYIDFKNQCVVRKLDEMVFDGTENWLNNGNDIVFLNWTNTDGSYIYNGVPKCISTHLPNANTVLEGEIYFRPTSSGLRIYRKGTGQKYTDNEGFKAFLAEEYAKGNPVTLITPYNDAVIKTEPIESPEILTGKGTINIMVDTDIQPSATTWQYYRK